MSKSITEAQRKYADVANWPAEYALRHTREVFDAAAKYHPDLLEPYVNRLTDLQPAEAQAVMREALRDTFNARHPVPAPRTVTAVFPQLI